MNCSNQVLFKMSRIQRQEFILKNKFYLDQAKLRILSQFSNIFNDTKNLSKEYLSTNGEFLSISNLDEKLQIIENVEGYYYDALTDLKRQIYLSTLAAIFHEWEKNLRSWLHDEALHWNNEQEYLSKFWKMNIQNLLEFLNDIGINLCQTTILEPLKVCNLIVNVYKHGDGKSLNNLKNICPKFLRETHENSKLTGIEFAYDYSFLNVNEEEIEEFSLAINNFWTNIPDNIFLNDIVKCQND